VDISFTVCLCVFVCLFVRLRISQARIKLAASNFAQRFVGVLGREYPILGNFVLPEAQNRMNWHTTKTIADRRQSPPLVALLPSVEGTAAYRQ